MRKIVPRTSVFFFEKRGRPLKFRLGFLENFVVRERASATLPQSNKVKRRKQKEKMENGALASSDDAKHRKEEGASE